MRRLVVILVFVTAWFGSDRADAAIFTWTVLQSPHIQQPVEQETDWPFPADQSRWVINPLAPTCSWDVDDLYSFYTQGKLAAEQSIDYTACVIGSPVQFRRCVNGDCGWWSTPLSYFESEVRASSPGLTVTLCYDKYPRCFTPTATYDAANKAYLYDTCTRESYHFDGWATSLTDPLLETIPDSHGGVGVVEQVTLTVTNTAAHGNADVFAQLGQDASVDGQNTGGCVGYDSNRVVTDYPYSYLDYST